ncbi:MAG TPA: glycogen debranching N-terminal domain-containing protein [Dehalococcoidia bacterium]|nr:glycogen debranching N-terminal domain-containing protein [Dehalococcoidia bacterium]
MPHSNRPDHVLRWRMLPEGEPRVITDIRDALIIREKALFLLTDMEGHVEVGNDSGFGLYHQDTRYLSGWELSLIGVEPVVLLSTAEEAFWMEQVMTNPELFDDAGNTLPSGSLQVRRQRVLDGAMVETTRITNYSTDELALTVQYGFAADFADIFEIRGFKRTQRGSTLETQLHSYGVIFRYRGTDGRRRQTRVRFRARPDELRADQAAFHITIPARSSHEITTRVTVDAISGSATVRRSIESIREEYQDWRRQGTEVITGNELFNRALGRSMADLRVLWMDQGGERYLVAGVPWYDTLFGRDALIAGYLTLPYRPQIAREVLVTLARLQGETHDEKREEEPGKILHERRECESAATGEVPFSRYYGSVDSTPLFLLLAAEYYRWTADLEFMRQLCPHLEAALKWIDDHGDADDDGFVEYQKKNPHGLDNQGWKDSWDGIVHQDGRLVAPPVALVEVQGYVYAAKRAIASVFDDLGDAARALTLRDQADDLRSAIERAFWVKSGYYGVALNGDKQLSTAVASNGGHLLWSGVPSAQRGQRQVDRLLRNDMFSGWGIRTLSSKAARHNPIGYHLGSIWPHDNALILAGCKRYAAEGVIHDVAHALFEAALTFPYFRLPELFGGAPRRAHQAPVPYPVACRPQAFAAATLPAILTSILGIVPDAPNNKLYLVNPSLPGWLQLVELLHLRIGTSTVDLAFRRSGGHTTVEVSNKQGDIEIVETPTWPDDA